jgi:TolB-like protein/tetratricopeptide (TPR) repeat protein
MTGRMIHRFADFELDVSAYTLRWQGRRVRIERRPMDLLILLVERRGELVTRAEIIDRLWGSDVFVEVDVAINSAIRKVRLALRDPADKPTFVETVQGRGYRFVAAVESPPRDASLDDPPVTIVVLPFVNLGGGPDREYIAEGFTEDVIAALGQVDPEHLTVIGRASVMFYKNSATSPADIGRALNATYLLEGSVRTEAESWRLTVRLMRLPEHVHMWSRSYDGRPNNMLEWQRELSEAIAGQIRVTVSPRHMVALGRRHSRNPAAYDLYLQGRHAWHQLTPVTNRRAIEHYMRAVELDSRYALAWSGIADAHAASGINADARPADVSGLARDAADRAVNNEPDLAEAQTSRGLVSYWFEWDWGAAEASHRRAIALDPSYGFAHLQLGIVLAYLGRIDEAKAALRRARELDPLWSLTHALSAHVDYIAADYSSSLEFALRSVAISPRSWIGYLHLAHAHERMGNPAAALHVLQDAEERAAGNSKLLSLRGFILASTGRTDEARAVASALEAIAAERYMPAYAVALVHAGLGDTERAFGWLERAYAERDVHMIFLVVDPKWEVCASDPRFQRLVERCGFTGTRSTA